MVATVTSAMRPSNEPVQIFLPLDIEKEHYTSRTMIGIVGGHRNAIDRDSLCNVDGPDAGGFHPKLGPNKASRDRGTVEGSREFATQATIVVTVKVADKVAHLISG